MLRQFFMLSIISDNLMKYFRIALHYHECYSLSHPSLLTVNLSGVNIHT